jgi:acetyl/propionyl-CoA carboxylase alpha subunit
VTEIRRVLVANRGEIADRVFRTCRLMGIDTVAVYSDADADAPYVVAADEAVHLPGTTPADTYLRGDLIIEAARATGADAIHPGYGFLSENASFARECAAAGLVFIGPPVEAIEVMGDKLKSKELMSRSGVPVLHGADVTHIEAEQALAAAAEIGYPVLVKASAGGGGRGMRIVTDDSGLIEAVASARREAASAFGDETVFLERYVTGPRHIEVQVMADDHGNCIALFERECSIQRRHQKVIEECPSPAVDETQRAELGAAAVAAARSVHYRGAGTVEFVMDAGGTFAFLEMNTRLQVEHPVTEQVTGLDLVRLQIEVAAGLPLPAAALAPRLHGHAVEARLYAEDVGAGYLPVTGVLDRFAVAPVPGLRVDTGVATGSVVSPYYDAMLAKVIVHAPSRSEAVRLLASALRRADIGGLTTNRDLLVRVLEHPDFRAGRIDTGFLERTGLAAAGPLVSGTEVGGYAVAAALSAQAVSRAAATVQPGIPSGWRNNRSAHQLVTYRTEVAEIRVGYTLTRDGLHAEINDEPMHGLVLHHCGPEIVDLTVADLRRRYRVQHYDERSDVAGPRGTVVLQHVHRFPSPGNADPPGSLVAPMPGSVQRVLVEIGQEIAVGTPVLVLEAMKMEHTLAAPQSGTVSTLTVMAGDQVDGGAVLAVIDEKEPEAAATGRA